ncbi:hypothetical protein LJC61_07830 [Ruminococcaceae bacterium OttesenSCG-928-A16]|nr:hypothetical protein [Ruminococcaceae bacterium OttesenSCG-928-A16]
MQTKRKTKRGKTPKAALANSAFAKKANRLLLFVKICSFVLPLFGLLATSIFSKWQNSPGAKGA